jgi:hypothetical protein
VTICSGPTSLGTVTADNAGNFAATVTIPSDTAVGQHSIVVTGPDPSGATHASVANVTVPAPAVPVAAAPRFTG